MTGSDASPSHHGASMPPATWLAASRHRGVVALVDGDVEAGLRQRERLPCAGDAGADDVGVRDIAYR